MCVQFTPAAVEFLRSKTGMDALMTNRKSFFEWVSIQSALSYTNPTRRTHKHRKVNHIEMASD
jgi:hypothetical protein